MTRESRVGTVVAGSFLCLLSIVIASKWRASEVSHEPEEQAQNQPETPKEPAAPKDESAPPPSPPAPPAPLAQAVFNTLPVGPASGPAALPAPGDGLAPLPAAPISTDPMAPAPTAPANDAEQTKKLKQLQEAKDPIPSPALAPLAPAPGPDAVKDPFAVAPPPAPMSPAVPDAAKTPAAAPMPEQPLFPVMEKKEEKKDASPFAPPGAPLPATGAPAPLDPLQSVQEKKEPPAAAPPALAPSAPAPQLPGFGPVAKEPAPKEEKAAPAPTPLISAPPSEPLPPVTTAPPANPAPVEPRPIVKEAPPPLGARLTDLPAPSTPIAPAPSSGRLPEVKTYPTQVRPEVCQPGDSSFAALSQRLYGSDRYASALQAFNREHVQADPAVKQDPPRLQAGTRVFVPPASLLDSAYGDLVRSPATTSTLPPVRISTPTPLGDPATIPLANPNLSSARVTPPPTADATTRYIVQGKEQMMLQIARDTLGDANRWGEIYRLNPHLLPQFPIPAGTEVRLPTGARVP